MSEMRALAEAYGMQACGMWGAARHGPAQALQLYAGMHRTHRAARLQRNARRCHAAHGARAMLA